MKLEIQNTTQYLENGSVVLYPTDTIWGLGCDIYNKKAIDRIYQIKKRVDSKALIILVSDLKMLKELVEINTHILSNNQYDKPTTIIYSNIKNIPENLLANDGSIAIRIPKDEFCIKLINDFGSPIISTSANVSGEKSPLNYGEINPLILDEVDYIVNLHQDDKSIKSPSRIIKVNDDDTYTILRK